MAPFLMSLLVLMSLQVYCACRHYCFTGSESPKGVCRSYWFCVLTGSGGKTVSAPSSNW